MTALPKTAENLKALGYAVKCFATKAEAADYLDHALDGISIGIGGSVTIQELGLYDRLAAHNTVYWHWANGAGECVSAMSAKVYLTSANAVAQSGEIVNIDGVGNRAASMLYGHEKVIFIVGRNKLTETYEEALWRARNVAAPKNARRLGRKTPCAVKADRCYNCKSPERVCRGQVVLWEPVLSMEMEVVLIDEELGY